MSYGFIIDGERQIYGKYHTIKSASIYSGGDMLSVNKPNEFYEYVVSVISSKNKDTSRTLPLININEYSNAITAQIGPSSQSPIDSSNAVYNLINNTGLREWVTGVGNMLNINEVSLINYFLGSGSNASVFNDLTGYAKLYIGLCSESTHKIYSILPINSYGYIDSLTRTVPYYVQALAVQLDTVNNTFSGAVFSNKKDSNGNMLSSQHYIKSFQFDRAVFKSYPYEIKNLPEFKYFCSDKEWLTLPFGSDGYGTLGFCAIPLADLKCPIPGSHFNKPIVEYMYNGMTKALNIVIGETSLPSSIDSYSSSLMPNTIYFDVASSLVNGHPTWCDVYMTDNDNVIREMAKCVPYITCSFIKKSYTHIKSQIRRVSNPYYVYDTSDAYVKFLENKSLIASVYRFLNKSGYSYDNYKLIIAGILDMTREYALHMLEFYDTIVNENRMRMYNYPSMDIVYTDIPNGSNTSENTVFRYNTYPFTGLFSAAGYPEPLVQEYITTYGDLACKVDNTNYIV